MKKKMGEIRIMSAMKNTEPGLEKMDIIKKLEVECRVNYYWVFYDPFPYVPIYNYEAAFFWAITLYFIIDSLRGT